jgi:hypothetical protein
VVITTNKKQAIDWKAFRPSVNRQRLNDGRVEYVCSHSDLIM